MRLSNRGKYALHAMVYLASKANEGPQTLSLIAGKDMPSQYLEQLLGMLRRKGLVNSVRGAQGGYELAVSPDQLTVAGILEATEDKPDFTPCTGGKSCPQYATCRTRSRLSDMTERVNRVMQGVTLRELVDTGEGEQKE